MHGRVLITVSALALAACSPKQAAAPAAPPAATAPSPAAEAPPPMPAASAPAPEAPPAAPVSAETTAATPPADPPYRFSPGDFPRQERRIAALIANAESRDTVGETPGVAAAGRHARERCATRKCVEAAYAAEEARLRKWEGSSEIR